MSDNARVWCDNFSPSYGLSSSIDKVTWTTVSTNIISAEIPAGTKVYLRGDTSTLESTTNGPGCRFYSDGAFNAGGNALSLYSPTLEPKELTNGYDLAYFFGSTGSLTSNGKKICECSVDFGPVKSAYRMFSGCSSLKALPAGFSAPNMTDASYMFTNCSSLSALPDGFSIPNVTNAEYMFDGCSSLKALPAGFSAPNVTDAFWMFRECSNLLALPDGFSIPNVARTYDMFHGCYKLSVIGHNVKIANGAEATRTDDTHMDKSLVTSIGDNFEWFTNAKFSGTWNPALGIRNVFPNATSVGSGWRVYDHYDGEGNGGGGEGSSSSSSGSGGGSPSGMYLRVTSSETVGGCAQLYNLTEGDPSMTPFYDTNPLNYHGVTSGGWVITIVYRDVKSIVDFYVANQNIPQTYHAGFSDYQWKSLADAISRIQVWNDEEKGKTINMTLTLE